MGTLYICIKLLGE